MAPRDRSPPSRHRRAHARVLHALDGSARAAGPADFRRVQRGVEVTMDACPLPDRHAVAVVRGFLTGHEHDTLLRWAEGERDAGRLNANKSGPARYFARYDDGDARVPAVFAAVKARALGIFGVTH